MAYWPVACLIPKNLLSLSACVWHWHQQSCPCPHSPSRHGNLSPSLGTVSRPADASWCYHHNDLLCANVLRHSKGGWMEESGEAESDRWLHDWPTDILRIGLSNTSGLFDWVIVNKAGSRVLRWFSYPRQTVFSSKSLFLKHISPRAQRTCKVKPQMCPFVINPGQMLPQRYSVVTKTDVF